MGTDGRGILLLSPAFAFPLETTPLIFTVGFTLFYVGSGMLLVGVLLCDVPRSRPVVVLAALGASSYSIYLWHLTASDLGRLTVELVSGTWLGFGAGAAVYVIGSLFVGVVMAKAIEVPALRFEIDGFRRAAIGRQNSRLTLYNAAFERGNFDLPFSASAHRPIVLQPRDPCPTARTCQVPEPLRPEPQSNLH